MSKENRINYMVNSGSKGKVLNIQQMIYLLGEHGLLMANVFPWDSSIGHYLTIQDLRMV